MKMHMIATVVATLSLGLSVAIAGPLESRGADDDVFYHFMPIAWRDSDSDPYRFGDFNGMTASLDYLEALGITAVWMNPIFPSPAYHGYQHGRADELNDRFGTEAEFLNFVQQAHARGIKVFVDFVVYGISHDSIWFQDAYGNPSSPYDDWLAFENSGNTQYLGSVYNSWNGDSVGFIHWDLRNSNPTGLVTDWAQKWLDPDEDGDPSDGIDGYRLDHVWNQYPNGPDGWGYNIDWWETWNANLETVNPDVFIFAEQADWGSTGADLLSAFDATFTKPFEFAARDALANEYAAPLYSSTEATLAALPEGKTFLGILGDHDVDRLASSIGSSMAKGKAAAAILLTQPFPPVIYHGDEIGMLGTKQDYGSDANDIPMREPFKWNAVAGPPMTNYHYLATNPDVYNLAFSQNNDGRSVEEQDGVTGSLLEEYKLLIAARKSHVALRQGSYHPVTASSTRIWAFLRYVESEETLLVAINVYGGSRTCNLDLSNVTIPGGSTTVQDVLTGEFLPDLTEANQASYSLSLDAYGYKILALNIVPNEPEPQEIDGLSIPSDMGPGSLIATQDNATGMGDNVNEINQLFVRVEDETLRVGVTGNLVTNGTGLAFFLDTISGGQNVLLTDGFPTPPDAIPLIDGMVLDSGFAPDRIVYVNTWSGSLYVDLYYLESSGPGEKRYVGNGTVNDLDGFLLGGSNPNGMLVALNNSNTNGVTGSDASGAATATSGCEMSLPFADVGIGAPEGTVKVMAMLVYGDGQVGNQFLPGLSGGYGNLGYVPLDLNDVPSQQYALIPLDRLPGDWDGDGDVDLDDYTEFLKCYTGPNGGPLGPGCNAFDSEADLDIDLVDFAAFQSAFTGS